MRFALAVFLVGCNVASTNATESPVTTDATCPPPPTLVTAATPASLRNDVMPIFGFSCNFGSCHGKARPDRVYLGARTGEDLDPSATATAVRAALLEASHRSDLPLVAPSQPEESFLLYKLDGDFCRIASRCAEGGCGDPMPMGATLDSAKRDVIRRWIAEGASDN